MEATATPTPDAEPCIDCEAPAAWSEAARDYRHVNRRTPCFLIGTSELWHEAEGFEPPCRRCGDTDRFIDGSDSVCSTCGTTRRRHDDPEPGR